MSVSRLARPTPPCPGAVVYRVNGTHRVQHRHACSRPVDVDVRGYEAGLCADCARLEHENRIDLRGDADADAPQTGRSRKSRWDPSA